VTNQGDRDRLRRANERSHWLADRAQRLDRDGQEMVLAYLCGLVPDAVEEALARHEHPTGRSVSVVPRPLFSVPRQTRD
jgi:hypothetical protein